MQIDRGEANHRQGLDWRLRGHGVVQPCRRQGDPGLDLRRKEGDATRIGDRELCLAGL